jgi:hypothetical protein
MDEINRLAQFRLRLFFQNYIYPEAEFEELNKITQYCKENDIELKFIIFPVYKGVDEYLEELNLTEMNQRFKVDIESMSETYDLDTGYVKNNRDNFFDYFHPRDPVIDLITRHIWCKKDISAEEKKGDSEF